MICLDKTTFYIYTFPHPSIHSNTREFFVQAGRRLLIQRTFRTPEGREYARTEVVKNQAVIDAYLRVVNKDKRFVNKGDSFR